MRINSAFIRNTLHFTLHLSGEDSVFISHFQAIKHRSVTVRTLWNWKYSKFLTCMFTSKYNTVFCFRVVFARCRGKKEQSIRTLVENVLCTSLYVSYGPLLMCWAPFSTGLKMLGRMLVTVTHCERPNLLWAYIYPYRWRRRNSNPPGGPKMYRSSIAISVHLATVSWTWQTSQTCDAGSNVILAVITESYFLWPKMSVGM